MLTDTVQNTRLNRLKEVLRIHDFAFSTEAGWERLEDHVATHGTFLREKYGLDASWEDALSSWYQNVFTPIYWAVSSWGFRTAFPRRPIGDLYLALSDHLLYLRERNPSVHEAEAAQSFVRHYGTGIGRYFSRFLIPTNW
ncbi:MAG: hypothetical protein GVY29_05925 [Spirochaetes bacterium]|jgi:hypothetical protein|nr:hypothetical protein [Spirochaetota bacterium]